MQVDQNMEHQFQTQLPYISDSDTTASNDSTYVQYLYDNLNVSKPDTTFVFQLKNIVLPADTDTIVHKVIYDKPSIFFPYKSKPIDIKPHVNHVQSNDWLTGLFILCLLILTWVRYEGNKRISQLFRAVLGRHNMNQLLRDGDIIHERITPGLMFIYLITLTALVVRLTRSYSIEIPGVDNMFLLFSFIAGVILILWLIKLSTIRISGKIFRTKSETDEYIVTNLIYNVCAGLIAFPFVFAAQYTDNQLIAYIALGIFGIGIIFRFVRSIFVGLSVQTFPVIHLFLYLCTLEILPFLVLYKFLIM